MQRKQSLWLLIAALCSVLTIFFPYGILQSSAAQTAVVSETALSGKTDYVLLGLVSVASLLALIVIFLYKNRGLQIKLTYALMLLCLGSVAYMLFDTFLAGRNHKLIVVLMGSNIYVGIIMPLLAKQSAPLQLV